MIVILIVLGLIALALAYASFRAFKKKRMLAGVVCAVIALIVAAIIVEGIIDGKSTEWETQYYTYLQEVAADEYVVQGDDEYIYRIKNPDKTTAYIEQISTEKNTEIVIEYLEDPNEVPYLEKSMRFENYILLTRYVFYIPAK